MPSTFWSNTIWYVLLACFSVVSVIIVIYKSQNRKFDIGFLCAVLGFMYHAEAVLLPLLNAYRYFPKIVKDLYSDSIMGNSFSQLSISTTLMLIVALKLSNRWYYIFGTAYYLIEELFIKLKIYIHNWYRSWHTFVGFILVAYLLRYWYYKILRSPKYYLYFITLFFATYTFIANIQLFFLYADIQTFSINIYSEYSRNQGITTHCYMMILIFSIIMLYKWKANLVWKGTGFVIYFLTLYVLQKIGFMHIKDGWFLVVTLSNIFGCYVGVMLMDHLLSKGSNQSNKLMKEL